MKKGEATRNRMLETAAGLLQRFGYHGTGLSQILAVSGAPKGSLYFHFPAGKEELCAAAASHSGEQMRSQLDALIGAFSDPAEAVQQVCRFMAQLLASTNYQVGCPVATLTLEMAPYSDAIHSAVATAFKDWLESIEARMIQSGIVGEEAQELATVTLAAIEGALLLSRAMRTTAALETVGKTLARLIRTRIGHSSA